MKSNNQTKMKVRICKEKMFLMNTKIPMGTRILIEKMKPGKNANKGSLWW